MHESTDDLLQACTVHKVCKTIFSLELKKLINVIFFRLKRPFKPEKHQIIPIDK